YSFHFSFLISVFDHAAAAVSGKNTACPFLYALSDTASYYAESMLVCIFVMGKRKKRAVSDEPTLIVIVRNGKANQVPWHKQKTYRNHPATFPLQAPCRQKRKNMRRADAWALP
ncbi:MAG TPA: hypothetical protein VHK70_08895, partial [Burkholderiaceae bacterium]|nr:hypothetical protein [Burkholderiaceae bacterium]